MIARDLDAICRALQELSIDVAKDASKNIGIDIHKLVNCKSNAHSDVIKKGEVVNNIKDGIDRMLETNTMGDFKYKMKAVGFQFLKDVDPNDNGALAEAIIEDVIGKCQEAINAGMTESIDNVVELLKTSNGDKYSLYAPYIQMAKNPIDDAALKVNHLVKMAISAYNTIGALYSAKFNGYSVSSAYIRDVAKQMIKAAKDGLIAGTPIDKNVPKLLAVTELTSISDEILHYEQNCNLSMNDQVLSLATTAKKAGADGVICSPLEVKNLRQKVGEDFLYVTPGIRPAGNAKDDQSRVATPLQAKEWGSTEP